MHDAVRDEPAMGVLVDSLPKDAAPADIRDRLRVELPALDAILYLDNNQGLLANAPAVSLLFRRAMGKTMGDLLVSKVKAVAGGAVIDFDTAPDSHPVTWMEAASRALPHKPVGLKIARDATQAEIMKTVQKMLPGLPSDIFTPDFPRRTLTGVVVQLHPVAEQEVGREAIYSYQGDFYDCLLRHLGWPVVLLLLGLFAMAILIEVGTAGVSSWVWVLMVTALGSGALGVLDAIYKCSHHPSW